MLFFKIPYYWHGSSIAIYMCNQIEVLGDRTDSPPTPTVWTPGILMDINIKFLDKIRNMSYKKDIFNKKRVTTRRSITGWLSRMAQGVSLSSTCTSPQAPVLFQVFKRKKFHLNSQIIKAMLFSFNDRFIADLLKITPLFHCKIITSGSGLNFKRLKDKDQTCDFAQFWKHRSQ